MWVRVRVDGKVALSHNSQHAAVYCDGVTSPSPSIGCPPPRAGRSAGPLGIEGRLVVHVTVSTPAYPWSPTPSGGDGAAEDLVWATAGSTVQVTRGGVDGSSYCWTCTPKLPQIGWYAMSGSQTLTVEEVIPIKVSGPTSAIPGEEITFTGTVHPEVKNLAWFYSAGDTAAAPSSSGGGSAVAACAGLTSCAFAPTVTGRMYAKGTVDNRTVSGGSEVVRVGARLKVECTPQAVTRGGSLTCVARPEPASATMEVLEWSFADAEGHTIQGPAGSSSWGGTMVVGGTIKVRARVNGAEKTESASVGVSPRSWAGLIQYPSEPAPERRGSPEFRYPPVDANNPTVNPHGAFGWFLGSSPRGEIGLGSGPNDGWNYLTGVVFSLPPRILLNTALFPDDPFFQAQVGGAGSCDQQFMQSLHGATLQHERRHYAIDRDFFGGAGTAQQLEAAVVFDPTASLSPTDLDKRFFGAVNEQRDQLQANLDASDVMYISCQFHLL